MTHKIEISREEYESRVLQALRKELLEEKPLIESDAPVKIEDIRLDTSGVEHQVHILFRETSRPECLFGFWSGSVEWGQDEASGPIVLDSQKGYWGPEEWASTLIVTWFEEQILAVGHGLPPDCDPDGITWVNGYRRLPPERARKERPEMSQGELDLLYESWGQTTGRIVRLFEKRDWFVSGSVGHSVTGSAEFEAEDFRYHVIAYRPVIEASWRGENPVFELYDEEGDFVAYVREVPTPEQAVRLLQRYGISTEEADSLRATLPNIPDEIVKDL
jgi:hypothetical protein